MQESDLRHTVSRVARGEEGAAALLYEHYYPRVFRYALGRLADAPAAEDIASETFARVLRDVNKFRWRGAGFEAWLFRIAANLVVDHTRRSRRETFVGDTRLESSGGIEPESAFLQHETSRELSALLNRLSPDQREVLLLRFAAGLDTADTAKVMGRKANAVRQLQYRALEQLRSRTPQAVSS